jgi:hypothetical protein
MASGGVALAPAGLALGLASGSELGDEAGLLQLREGAGNRAHGDLHRVVGVGELIARRGQRAPAEFAQGNDAEFLGNQMAGEAAGVLSQGVGLCATRRTPPSDRRFDDDPCPGVERRGSVGQRGARGSSGA